MQELTRQQEAVIAQLALEHGRVEVRPRGNGVVTVVANFKATHFDADGMPVESPKLDVEQATVTIPIDLLRLVLGDERVDVAIKSASIEVGVDSAQHYVGGFLRSAVLGALEACAQGPVS